MEFIYIYPIYRTYIEEFMEKKWRKDWFIYSGEKVVHTGVGWCGGKCFIIKGWEKLV